jgi:hypothetical protein
MWWAWLLLVGVVVFYNVASGEAGQLSLERREDWDHTPNGTFRFILYGNPRFAQNIASYLHLLLKLKTKILNDGQWKHGTIVSWTLASLYSRK